jgi:hypothetical protein
MSQGERGGANLGQQKTYITTIYTHTSPLEYTFLQNAERIPSRRGVLPTVLCLERLASRTCVGVASAPIPRAYH